MRRRSPQTLTDLVESYVRELVDREGNEAAIARKLGIHRQGLHEALHGTKRGIRLAHLDQLAVNAGMTTEQLLADLLKFSRRSR